MGQPSYTREGGTGAHRSSFLDQLQPPSFRGSVVKNPPPNAGDAGDSDLILGLERSPAGGNGNPFQYSCLENSMDRRAWRVTVHGVAKYQTRVSNWAHTSPSGSSPVQAQSQNTLGSPSSGSKPTPVLDSISPHQLSSSHPFLGVHKMSPTRTLKVIPPEQVLFQFLPVALCNSRTSINHS